MRSVSQWMKRNITTKKMSRTDHICMKQDMNLSFIQLPKFNTNLVVGDKVIINGGKGIILFIKSNEITLAGNGLRWTIHLNEIQTFDRV